MAIFVLDLILPGNPHFQPKVSPSTVETFAEPTVMCLKELEVLFVNEVQSHDVLLLQ